MITTPPFQSILTQVNIRFFFERQIMAFFFSEKGGLQLATFRIEKTKDYTVMANHHLKNKSLSLKSKGLLSVMLSLPEEWNYSIKGLTAICREGTESIGNAIKELEVNGYIKRNRLRDDKGKITDVEYIIYERPYLIQKQLNPSLGKPYPENPIMDNPSTDKSLQLNNNKLNTDLSNIEESSPIQSIKTDGRGKELISIYRDIVKDNIEYDILSSDKKINKTMLDEIVDLITETLGTSKKVLTIASDDYPADVVKAKFLKLTSEHIMYVMDRLKESTTDVKNVKKYLLAALFNAPSTIDSYYTLKVNHDLYGN